jgi:hypothetical protein
MAVRTAGRAGAPGATEKVALRSRTTTARRTTAARASGQADRSSSSASATSSSLVLATTASAPLDTSDRCEALSPNSRRLSNTHCIVRPGRPMNAERVTSRSSHRLTVTIGEPGVASAAANTAASGGGSGQNAARSPYHGTAQITARGQISWSPDRTDSEAAGHAPITAARPVRTAPPRPSMNERAGTA